MFKVFMWDFFPFHDIVNSRKMYLHGEEFDSLLETHFDATLKQACCQWRHSQLHFLQFPSEKSINCGLVFLLCCLKNHFLTCKFDRRDCRREQFLQCDLSLFTDVVFPENSNPPEMLITVGNAHLKIHSQCFTRIYPSYL